MMGFVDKLLGRKPCPRCGETLGMTMPGNGSVCIRCDSYVAKAEGGVALVQGDRIADRPWFASPLPWGEVRAVQEGAVLELSAASALTSMLMTKDGGARRLEANWPGGCCMCGRPPARVETIARKVTVPHIKGALSIGDQTVTLVAENIPHCGDHRNGVAFGRVWIATPISYSIYGLLFHSLAYRNAFRALNNWDWPRW
jgi:hypothetical protein